MCFLQYGMSKLYCVCCEYIEVYNIFHIGYLENQVPIYNISRCVCL